MFPAGLEERLTEPALYSYISLRVIYQFESKYALILYEILKRYADRDAIEPYWAVKTPELRDLLGCRERLKDWKDFRRRALNPALEEIDRLSEFAVEVLEIRQGGGRGGGKVVGVTFRIRRKASERRKPRCANSTNPGYSAEAKRSFSLKSRRRQLRSVGYQDRTPECASGGKSEPKSLVSAYQQRRRRLRT